MEIVVAGRPTAPSIRTEPRTAPLALVVPLFGGAMLLSGFLLFLVEPMIARMVLPVLGGAPMVWNGCVVFFQIVMLGGYGYAFAASRWLSLRRHVMLHVALLAMPALVLPVLITPASVAPPGGSPLVWLLTVLAGTVGLPFFVLSTTASVLQHWLSRTNHPSAKDPYFLYAASNAGCLLALAAYPLVIERAFTLTRQAQIWTAAYGLFALLAAACGVYAWRAHRDASQDVANPDRHVAGFNDRLPVDIRHAHLDAGHGETMSARRRLSWIVLAFVPSSLMLAVTSYISTDIAAVPLLWIVPLALYLATFTLAFGRRAVQARLIAQRALPLLVVPLAIFMVARVREPLTLIVLLHLASFAVIALVCHADLAADRPAPANLTEFYFWISFGGMLGGIFNTFVAPNLFTGVTEYPLVMLLACVVFQPAAQYGEVAQYKVPAVVAVATLLAIAGCRAFNASLGWQLAALSLPAIVTFSQRGRGLRFGASVAALLAGGMLLTDGDGRVLHATRTFFGVYRVNEDARGRYHGLAHGTTLHGLQALAPERRREALTYYHSTGPFGEAWRALPGAAGGHDIAAVGLGVGTLATYATPDQRWTFFEIDPAIEQIARTPAYFTFLPECGRRCRVVIGDARMSLGRVPEAAYDLIVLDAFSSDSIPLHLMTREAMALYLSRLRPSGALLIHVSNRHLRLAPIVGRLAADRGLYAARRLETGGADWPEGKNGSDWIAVSRNAGDVAPLIADHGWQPLAVSPDVPLWTDDYSNILSVLDLH